MLPRTGAVNTIHTRLGTMAKSEYNKFSAVAEKLKIIQEKVRSVCQGLRLDVETALNVRLAVDRFFFFTQGRGLRRRSRPRPPGTTTNQHGPFNHLIDKANSSRMQRRPDSSTLVSLECSPIGSQRLCRLMRRMW